MLFFPLWCCCSHFWCCHNAAYGTRTFGYWTGHKSDLGFDSLRSNLWTQTVMKTGLSCHEISGILSRFEMNVSPPVSNFHPKQTHQLSTEWCSRWGLAIRPPRLHSGGYLQTAFRETDKIMVPALLWVGRKETERNYEEICSCWFGSAQSFPSKSVVTSLISNILRFGGELGRVQLCGEACTGQDMARKWYSAKKHEKTGTVFFPNQPEQTLSQHKDWEIPLLSVGLQRCPQHFGQLQQELWAEH